MPQSLSKVYMHLVFSTKNRERFPLEELRTRIHEYLGGTLRGLDCPPIDINSEPDHVHLLFLMSRNHSIAKIVGELKEDSSKWLKTIGLQFASFHWQRGYAIFSLSESQVDAVRAYIRNQQEHHKEQSFQDELRKLLAKHNIEFDERYVWD